MKFRLILLSILAFCYTLAYFTFGSWKTTMNNGDSSGYYMHLVSSAINQDVGDYTKTINDYLEAYPNAKDPRKDKFGIRKTEKGRYYIKYTLGVAVMELPSLVVAHLIAKNNDAYKANGWSTPYALCINFSKIIYILLGFLFLIKALLQYFENHIVAITTISIALGTNLLYHGTFLSLAHSFLFFDFCLLIYLSQRFYVKPSNSKALGIGLLVGLITLTRVPEVVGLLIPLLWDVKSTGDLKSRLNFFKLNPSYLLIAAVGLIIAFSPQVIYWHYVSGELFFNPYQGENFNFLKPNIIDGWFNFRNGWLIYTPIMLFSLFGFAYMKKQKVKVAFFPALLFTALIAWIHYSYYVWNFYPGMGSRPMIECYPILAFPLASFFGKFLQGKASQWAITFFTIFFISLNIFQCWQMNEGIIYTQNGNAAFYKETFGQTKSSLASLQSYDVKRAQPIKSELTFIDTLLVNNFDLPNTSNSTKDQRYSGTQSIISNSEIAAETILNISETELQSYDWVYVSVKALRKQADMVWNRESLEELFCVLEDENGKKVKSSKIKIAAHIGNKNNSIFHVGTPNKWDEAGFYFRISNKLKDTWRLKVFVRNLHGHKLYLDDLTMIHFKEM